MANYISHSIISEQVYNKLIKRNKFNIDIDKNVMKLFSLGQDLTYLNRSCFLDAHSINSRKFFVETTKYIYDNNLQYNTEVMSYLYGHITHYVVDSIVHEIINKNIKEINKISIIKPHSVIECEIDKYLMQKYNYDSSFLRSNVMKSKVINSIINTTYRNTYGYMNINNSYKKVIKLASISNNNLLYMYDNNKLYNLLSNINNYNFDSRLINDSKYVDKFICDSIKESEKLIIAVNKYLYKHHKEKYLNVFDNTPYDISITNITNEKFNKLPIYTSINIGLK